MPQDSVIGLVLLSALYISHTINTKYYNNYFADGTAILAVDETTEE